MVRPLLYRRSSIGAAALALCVTLTVAPGALATTPTIERLPTRTFVYDAKQTPLTDMLRDFAGAIGVPIIIADGVTGTVNARFYIAPRGFLDLISRSFGLLWYHDGSALHVYPSSQIQTRLYRLAGQPAAAVEHRLTAFGLLDGRYPVRVMSDGDVTLAFVSGPPRHIELVDALLQATDGPETPTRPPVVRAFALVHASAVDRTTQGVAVPGVAKQLADFFGGLTSAAATAGPDRGASMVGDVTQATESMVASAAALVGSPEARARRDSALRDTAGALKSGSAPPPASPSQGPKGPLVVVAAAPQAAAAPPPLFVADESTNQVLVRAPAEQMADIEAMIARLDVEREMIEVEATIIDVSSDEVESLGFDWRVTGDATIRNLELTPAVPTTTTSGAIPQGGGFTITTLLASGGRELLARIRALEARGTARVVSQPRVLGAANHTAVLSDTRSASIRVAGNQDARLYTVETGTTLQVTPRLIPQPDRPRISLALLIEDGGFSTQSVDDVPIAQRTSISTIATLLEGQALLVGGIEVEGSSSGRSGIPGLAHIPYVGALFRFDSTQSARRQRLFLITPKRVQLSGLAAASSPAVPVVPPSSPEPVVPAVSASQPR
jgi:type III secretion protein C